MVYIECAMFSLLFDEFCVQHWVDVYSEFLVMGQEHIQQALQCDKRKCSKFYLEIDAFLLNGFDEKYFM